MYVYKKQSHAFVMSKIKTDWIIYMHDPCVKGGPLSLFRHKSAKQKCKRLKKENYDAILLMLTIQIVPLIGQE